VCDIVVLTKHTAKVASTEEDAAASVVTLDARLLAEMGSNGVHDYVSTDETCATLLEAVDRA